MLREPEASATDVEDVVFAHQEVTLTLPASKVDWQAKGCRRSWKCLCDKGLICPFHVLKAHVLSKRAEGVVSGPLFPNGEGNYCAKQPVVDSIRKAVDLTGGKSLDGNGRWAIFGHTFRIAGPHHHPVAWKVGLLGSAILFSRGTSHEHGRSDVFPGVTSLGFC